MGSAPENGGLQDIRGHEESDDGWHLHQETILLIEGFNWHQSGLFKDKRIQLATRNTCQEKQ